MTANDPQPSGDHLPTSVARGVPGGATRIPRLTTTHGRVGPGGGPPVEVVGGGFVDDELTRARRARAALQDSPGDEPVVLRFSDYSPMESLFVTTASCSGSGTGETSGRTNGIEHPTTTLGVDDDADWKTIRAAHRKLLAQLHPDRFVTADERTRQEAADRLAAINIAYHELERTRRAV